MMFDSDSYKDLIKSIVENFGDTNKAIESIDFSLPMLGIVMQVSNSKDLLSDVLGNGAIDVAIPIHSSNGTGRVMAQLLKSNHGSFELPKLGSTVIVFGVGKASVNATRYYYTLQTPIDINPHKSTFGMGDYYNTEPIGFTTKDAAAYENYIGGRYVSKVIKNPGEAKIIASSNDFILYQSDKTKDIELKGSDDYFLRLNVGNNGKVFIGYLDSKTDAFQTGSADIDINCGIAGDLDVTTISGNINVKTTSGYIKLMAGNCYILIDSSGIYINGETMVSKELHWQTVGFSPTGTPPIYATATANKGSTHTHPTGTGPSGPPTPGT